MAIVDGVCGYRPSCRLGLLWCAVDNEMNRSQYLSRGFIRFKTGESWLRVATGSVVDYVLSSDSLNLTNFSHSSGDSRFDLNPTALLVVWCAKIQFPRHHQWYRVEQGDVELCTAPPQTASRL